MCCGHPTRNGSCENATGWRVARRCRCGARRMPSSTSPITSAHGCDPSWRAAVTASAVCRGRRKVVRLPRGTILPSFASRRINYAARGQRHTVSYVVTRISNYTNVCTYGCKFCAFSRQNARDLRGKPYDLTLVKSSAGRARQWAGRDGGVPAGRHQSGLYRRDLSRYCPRGARACPTAPSSFRRRGDPGSERRSILPPSEAFCKG